MNNEILNSQNKQLLIYLSLASTSKSYSLITDLRSKEVFKDSEVFNLEFNYEWLFLMKTKSGKTGKSGGFVEHIEISESELLLNTLCDFQDGLVLFLV